MSDVNGDLPTIVVEFHPSCQGVKVIQKGFASPQMVKAVLQMASDELDHQIRLQKAMQLQQQAAEAEQAQRIARDLRRT